MTNQRFWVVVAARFWWNHFECGNCCINCTSLFLNRLTSPWIEMTDPRMAYLEIVSFLEEKRKLDVLFFFGGNGVYPKCRVLSKISAASAEQGLEQGSPLFQPWKLICWGLLIDRCTCCCQYHSHYASLLLWSLFFCFFFFSLWWLWYLTDLTCFFCINFRHQKQHHGSIGHILPRSKVLGAVAGSKLLLCRGWWVFWENGQVLNSSFGENEGF